MLTVIGKSSWDVLLFMICFNKVIVSLESFLTLVFMYDFKELWLQNFFTMFASNLTEYDPLYYILGILAFQTATVNKLRRNISWKTRVLLWTRNEDID